MTIHVNIGEAKTRLSELVAAVERGEDVVLNKAGVPKVRMVAFDRDEQTDAAAIAERRRSAFGMYSHLVDSDRVPLVRDLKPTEEELEANYRRKFGPAD